MIVLIGSAIVGVNATDEVIDFVVDAHFQITDSYEQ